MFIQVDVVVHASLGAVRSWLADGTGMVGPFTAALAERDGTGSASAMRAAGWPVPARIHGRPVVATLPARQRGAEVVIPLRCYSPFSTDDRPTVDADLELSEETADTTRLAFVGVFRAARDSSNASESESAQNDRVRNSVQDFLTLLANDCERHSG